MTYNEFLVVLKDLVDCKISCKQGYDQILSLLDENEVGVSDSSKEHGGLPHVRKSEGEAKEIDGISGESEQITLGNRIDDESLCQCDFMYEPDFDNPGHCKLCGNEIR